MWRFRNIRRAKTSLEERGYIHWGIILKRLLDE
jgi:hypothetical protein